MPPFRFVLDVCRKTLSGGTGEPFVSRGKSRRLNCAGITWFPNAKTIIGPYGCPAVKLHVLVSNHSSGASVDNALCGERAQASFRALLSSTLRLTENAGLLTMGTTLLRLVDRMGRKCCRISLATCSEQSMPCW